MNNVEPDLKQQPFTSADAPAFDHTTPEFEPLSQHLSPDHRELGRESFPRTTCSVNVVLPSEAFAGKLRRRHWLRSIFIRCFYKLEWPGELVVDKRRFVGVALVFFAGVFLPGIYLFNRAATARSLESAQNTPASLGPTTSEPKFTVLGGSMRRALRPGDLQTFQEPPQVPPLPSLAPTTSPTSRLLEVPPSPAHPAPHAPLGRSDVQARVSGVPAERTPWDGRTPEIFAFLAPEERNPARVFIFSQPEPPGPSSIPAHPDPHTPGESFDERRQRGAETPPSPDRVGQFFERPGQVISARFITGLALAPGLEPTPILASSDDPRWCGLDACPPVTWLGQATYSGGPRVQMMITAALVEGHMYPVQAIALGSDMIAGVPASISPRPPTVAAQVIAATLAAGRDYLRTLEERQVTISNGWLSITQNTNPDLLAYLLSHIAESFLTPTRQATVDVAEIAPRTELRLLMLTTKGR